MRCWGAGVLGCLGARVLRCFGACVLSAFALTAWSDPAFAQSTEAPTLRAHRVTVSGGLTWSGSYPIGDANAVLRTNATGSAPPPFTLFSVASTVESIAGIEGRVGFTLTPSLAVEAGASFAKPTISLSISHDPEVGPQELEGEELQQYVFDAGAVWQLPIWLGRRARPFLSGGAGYLRQLHQERTLVETGRIYYAGAGLRYWIRGGSGRSRSLGLRGDARATWKQNGIDFEERTRFYPTVSVFLFVGF